MNSKIYKDLRRVYLLEDNIAREAYFIWEHEGRPDGGRLLPNGRRLQDQHWFSAIERLELAAEMDADNFHFVSPVGRSQILAVADEPRDLDQEETCSKKVLPVG